MPTAVGATLFVWSKREASPSDIGASGRHRLEGGCGAGAGEPEYEARLVLPEDQQTVVDLVQRLARVRKVPVELVDLGRARHFIERRRALERGWTDFPVLVAANGRTLAGSAAFSDETVIKVLTDGTYVPR
jgi:hypothetical protein